MHAGTPAGAAGALASTVSTLTRAFLATTVRVLMPVVQGDHVRILFPDVLECARLTLRTCGAVRELEISGDLGGVIRRTDPAEFYSDQNDINKFDLIINNARKKNHWIATN